MAKTRIWCVVAIMSLASEALADPATTSPEQGFDLGDIQHPRGLAMGGAQYALGTSTTAIFYNPANLGLSRVYHFEGLASFNPEARRQSYGGAIADSVTSRVAGGLGGAWSQIDPDGVGRSWMDLRLALAYPASDKLSFGIAGRYFRSEQSTGRGPFGGSLASGGSPDAPLLQKLTFDAGMTLTPVSGLHIAAAGRNLTNVGSSLMPTLAVLGIGYAVESFGVEGNVLFDFTTWGKMKTRTMVGGEYFIASKFPIRAGYRYDDGLKVHALSGGLGYVDRKFSIDAGIRRDIVADHPATMIGLGLRYFYESAAAPDNGDGF